MTESSPWLTRLELAERLRVPATTLADWAVDKKGPPYAKFGRHVRYRMDLVEAWEEDQIKGLAS